MGNICERKSYCNKWLDDDTIGTYTYYHLSCGKFRTLNVCQCCCCFGCGYRSGKVNAHKYPNWTQIQDTFEFDYLENADLVISRSSNLCCRYCCCRDSKEVKQFLENLWIEPTNSFLKANGFECDLVCCNKSTIMIRIKECKDDIENTTEL